MTRFLIAACLVTVSALISGWAHAEPRKGRCVLISEKDGTQVIVCPKVVIRGGK